VKSLMEQIMNQRQKSVTLSSGTASPQASQSTFHHNVAFGSEPERCAAQLQLVPPETALRLKSDAIPAKSANT
jgi:hypothetical protein